jgi:hypothetical protein
MDRSGKDAKSGSFRPEWVAFYSRNSGFLFPEQVASLPRSMHLPIKLRGIYSMAETQVLHEGLAQYAYGVLREGN